ncbi:MAG: aminotransferase class I/II-fold pyridoxal phosphate-dependent enzyme [Amylibacter sp.]|jgi:dTDP-4-amino-4,6-dideoxygalactose transaminase|tara:strand:+ start:37580 stop:38776 length:1197 start_codon:yes stop_codon:yes gene_type:complete
MVLKFMGSFTQQEPIPEAAIEAAIAVMRHGRLHRYNVALGEIAETVLLEQEFAQSCGAKYCLAVASGGYALSTALRSCGLKHGDVVLTNAFTLAPVPGSIQGAGGQPVFVEITKDLVLDLDDLQLKIQSTKAKFLMLSHMRGHLVDMDALIKITDKAGVQVIEDCAHTMGANWNGVPSGRSGVVGCYSTQTFKHINSGEGGFIITDNAEIMARATILSGSYMLYDSHLAGAPSDAFENIRLDTPNCSGRMDNLRAAILRPQLAKLPSQARRWNKRYYALEAGLSRINNLRLIARPKKEYFVASSFQFCLPNFNEDQVRSVVAGCDARGVQLKWFGANTPVGFTSRHDSWRYVDAQNLPNTDAILAVLLDMRIPLTLSMRDCEVISLIIKEEVESIKLC